MFGIASVENITAAAVGIAALFWVGTGLAATLGYRRLPGLGAVEPLPDVQLPTLTLIAAAKDEAPRVEAGARSLLGQGYPGALVLIVDDRSTDGTGTILDRLAAAEPRLRVIHVGALPPGWIGKCHALAKAAEAAGTEWLLFTDGDVTLVPDAARRAVSLAVREGCDHVTVGPEMRVRGIGEAAFVGFFTVLFNALIRPWRAADPRRRESIGVGAFNLVRSESYRRSGGHARIRYELLDDLALGRILKSSGARQQFARHDGRVRVRWHHGVAGLVRGIEKNAFPAAGYSVPLALGGCAFVLGVSLAPVVGLALPGIPARIAAASAWAGIFLAYGAAGRAVSIRAGLAPLMPLGAALFAWALLRSTLLALRRRGVLWRGTFYPLGELRRARVR